MRHRLREAKMSALWSGVRGLAGPRPLAAVLIVSIDGGSTWSDLHLGGPFDLSSLPGGVGDHQELHAAANQLGASFVLGAPAAGDGPDDVFYARIGFAAATAGRHGRNAHR
jgi:hypothetical protein